MSSQHTLSTVSPQSGGAGTQYIFASWSDGGAQSHTITSPTSNATYTASFNAQYALTTIADPAAGGSIAVNPIGAPAPCIALAGYSCYWYNGSTSVAITASANTGYSFTNWSGDLSGSTNPNSIIMNGPKTVTATFGLMDFALAPSGSSLSISKGSSTTNTYTVTSVNGFNSAVTLSLSGQPSGVTGSFNPNPVTPPANSSATSTLTINVDASVACNTYPLTVTGTNGSLTHTATLSLTVTGCPGLRGEYYDNSDLTGLSLTRTDPTIDFDWGTGSPDAAIGPDTFSVRWTGKIQVDHDETYRFDVVTDDGVRLWVDGHLVVNYWQTGGISTYGSISLTVGQHDVKMEFYENTGTAMAQLYWSSPSTPYAIIPQDHLQPPDSSGNAPVLSWTGEANYTSDGLDPQTGDTSTVFTYRVLYTDADGDAPMSGYPRLHILKAGVEIAGSPFAMAFVSGSYAGGAIYSYSTTLPEGTDYTHYFDAKDSTGLQAVAAPTAPTPTVLFDAPDVGAVPPPVSSGDIDGSGRVDGFDRGRLGAAFYSSAGDSNWNPDADLNGDGTVDGSDLEILAVNFGKTM